ncbi:MAG: hypothetical protein K8R64_02875 [Methanosarcinaceae archaeon]|nr:hypothetical protein [Methanosarcinaceae archaeon]
MACAEGPYDIKENYNVTGLDEVTGKQPDIVYPVFGYENHSYTFKVNYTVANVIPENITVVFYWDTWRNTGIGNRTELNNTDRIDLTDNVSQWEATHSWPRNGTYGIQIGVFEDNELIKLSYWMPIDIRDDIKPNKPHELYMINPEDDTKKAILYYNKAGNPTYYGYENEFYTFTTNATDNETNMNLWYNFSWGDGNSDVTRRAPSGTPANYSHSWSLNKTPYIISTKAIKRDFYDPNNDVESEVNSSASIIIKKNTEPVKNLGIIISLVGLFFIALTGIKETVAIEVPIFGHEFRRRSIQYAIGVLLILIGLYMVFVMGRCPWDMPWPFEGLFYDKIR